MSNTDHFISVKMHLEFAKAQLAEDELFSLGALSTQVINTPSKFHLEANDEVEVLALFMPQKDLAKRLTKHLKNKFAHAKIICEEMQNQDWQLNFVNSCKTFLIEPCIYIVPSFEIDEFHQTHKNDLFIEMDPQNAFGTGRHETTQLCLSVIYNYLHKKPKKYLNEIKALDVGCGSGILGILMGKLGIKNILATDIDEFALKTAEENFRKNEVAAFVALVDEHFMYQKNTFDIVAANILAGTLKEMSTNLFECLKPNGYLILSGILAEQAEEVINVFTQKGLNFTCNKQMGDWVCLEFSK